MTIPTDAELNELLGKHWPAFALQGAVPLTWLRSAMRKAIAKWGTPPAVAGEPVAYLHDDGYWTAAKTDVGRSLNDRLLFAGSPKVAVYTAPQPTQSVPPAGREPLKPDQVAEIADAAHREYDRLVSSGQCAPRWSAVFACLLEQHHGIGIKGKEAGNADT